MLTATAASVKSAIFSDNELTVTIEKPPYVFKLPEELKYYLNVVFDKNIFVVESVNGGTVQRQGKYGVNVCCDENTIRICFKARSAAASEIAN